MLTLVLASAFLIFPILAIGWFLEFFILNLYFPEAVLHKICVSRCVLSPRAWVHSSLALTLLCLQNAEMGARPHRRSRILICM